MSEERRNSRPAGPGKRPATPAAARRRYSRRKGCRFCGDKDIKIDYKEIRTLRYFISERGKIVPRRISGNCAEHQRKICEAIKRARNIALLPFTAGHSLD